MDEDIAQLEKLLFGVVNGGHDVAQAYIATDPRISDDERKARSEIATDVGSALQGLILLGGALVRVKRELERE